MYTLKKILVKYYAKSLTRTMKEEFGNIVKKIDKLEKNSEFKLSEEISIVDVEDAVSYFKEEKEKLDRERDSIPNDLGEIMSSILGNVIDFFEKIKTNISNNDFENFKLNVGEFINYLEKVDKLTGKEKVVIGSLLAVVSFFLSAAVILPIIGHHLHKKNKKKYSK